ncbi:MAG: helix-turn-helix transcriptional regulator [Oscillospiraceae bacterium]|jgi:transcriptional regulator with XRE-family HTH domain|nr:helix-turn-helix transcriptional regulator [Oscillospiraceae bacterium]
MSFLEKLDYLMKTHGLNRHSLSNACGVPYTTIDGFYKKGYANAKVPTLKKIASFFGVTLDYLIIDEIVDPSYGLEHGTGEISATGARPNNVRLKKVRKALKLSQSDFGEKLGLTPTAISKLESGSNNITDRVIFAACREFGINESWLRTGKGEMFVNSDETLISEIAEEYRLDDIDKAILEAYLKLPDERRYPVRDFLVSLAKAVEKGETNSVDAFMERHPLELPAYTREEAEKEYNTRLTEDEAVALLRQRYADSKKGGEESITSGKAANGE